MAATSLPLEIQQQILSLLDSKSFHNARNVCRWWRFASTASMLLHRRLRKLPMHSTIGMQDLNPNELDCLFSQAAYRLMFGLKIVEKQSSADRSHSSCKLPVRPRSAASKDGNRLVTLNDRTVTLFDTSGLSLPVISQRQLHEMKDLPVGCPGLRPRAFAQHQLALSSAGSLLAVAMHRTIQIYDLSEGGTREVVTRHIVDPCAHGVARLNFDQNDHMLRVQLTGSDTVLYLGSPAKDEVAIAEFGHWKSDSGLKHIFVDSSRLAVALHERNRTRLAGVQLLRPLENGYLFCAQRHGGGASSQYVLGHLECVTNPYTSTQIVDHTSVVELIALESFISSREFAMTELSSIGMGTWDTMPSAHELPQFALSGDLLVAAERDKKSTRSLPHWTQLFVYRVPGGRHLRVLIEDYRQMGAAEKSRRGIDGTGYSIAAIPLCIGTAAGEIKNLQFYQTDSVDGPSRILKVDGEDATRVWSLLN